MKMISLWRALCLLGAFVPVVSLSLWADQTVVIDGNGAARRFDGIGAVSGGGGTSAACLSLVSGNPARFLTGSGDQSNIF